MMNKTIYALYNEKRIKLRERNNKFFAPIRRRHLKDKDFTIISNNCWAGHVYRYYGLRYNTPTIGLYIWANDYMVLLQNLRTFLESKLFFITADESLHREELIKRGHQDKPIGKLMVDDKSVEIVFLHYANEEEARVKWERRVRRVNYDHLIIKNSYQNGFCDDMIEEFERLPFENKVCFVHKPTLVGKHIIYFKGFEKCQELLNDTNDFKKYINLEMLLNS